MKIGPPSLQNTYVVFTWKGNGMPSVGQPVFKVCDPLLSMVTLALGQLCDFSSL